MRGLIFASQIEAQPFIDGLNLKKIDDSLYRIYRHPDDDLLLFICGIGCLAAAIGATYLQNKYKVDEIINLGAVGALSSDLKYGEIVLIDSCVDLDRFNYTQKSKNLKVVPLNNQEKSVTLGTRSWPVTDATERLFLAKHADVVDMEGHSIAKSCLQFKTKFYFIKIISDTKEHTTDKSIVENIKELRGDLFNYYISLEK